MSSVAPRVPQGWFDGRWVPSDEITIALDDLGFVQGVTVVERLRTFAGALPLLDAHLQRLEHSASLLEIGELPARTQLAGVLLEMLDRNRAWRAAQPDIGIVLFATPGRVGHPEQGPTVGAYPLALDWRRFARLLSAGQPLVVSDVVQPPPQSWPRQAKCRSRIHFYRADRAARRRDPDAAAVLRDDDGSVTETSSANLWLVRGRLLESPPRERVLPGITQQAVEPAAREAGLEIRRRSLRPDELATADEVLLMGTGPGIWAGTSVDGQQIGDASPGPICRLLQERLGRTLGVDLVAQAAQAHGG